MITVKPGKNVKNVVVRLKGKRHVLTPTTESHILYSAVEELARVILRKQEENNVK